MNKVCHLVGWQTFSFVIKPKMKTLVYLCIVGNTTGDIIKQVGIKGANLIVAKKLLPKISGEIIKKINQKVGYRLLTKGGSK